MGKIAIELENVLIWSGQRGVKTGAIRTAQALLCWPFDEPDAGIVSPQGHYYITRPIGRAIIHNQNRDFRKYDAYLLYELRDMLAFVVGGDHR